MDIQLIKRSAFALFLSLLIPATALAVDQILDRVHGYNSTVVLDMEFDDPDRGNVHFSEVVNDSLANFTACKITAINGLWCLDGKDIFHWADPASSALPVLEFSCGDDTLGLDTKKDNTCTSMTVDATGAVYIAGKNKGKTHSLIKLVENPGSCPVGFNELTDSPDWCADLLTTGRPLVVDMIAIDGDVANRFNPDCPSCAAGKGTILLEQRTDAVFVADDGTTIEIAGGKNDWGFAGNEKLQSLALVQTDDGAGGYDSTLVATTTKDRILAADTDGTPDGRPVFHIANERTSNVTCNSDDQKYGIRASSKSGVIYVTDHAYCDFLALEPVSAVGPVTGLDNVDEGGMDLTLETDPHGLNGATLAPGIAIDLSTCSGSGCGLAVGQSGNVAATLSNVQLTTNVTGLTLFQITAIPDCRTSLALMEECRDLLGLTSVNELFTTGIILDQTVGYGVVGAEPAAQDLNISPLFPQEIRDLFPDGLPDMWIQRWVRGQNGHFDAFLGITDATFVGAADLVMEVEDLTGAELGCTNPLPGTINIDIEELIGYDVAAKVSEDFVSIDRNAIPGNQDHESHLINVDCGSTFAKIGRWSLVIINGEFPKVTFYDGVVTGPLDDPDTPEIEEGPDDAIFAKLVLELFDDLVLAVDQLACNAVDGTVLVPQSSPPLSGPTCSNFSAAASNSRQKLAKCIDATKQPKNSQRNENCNAAEVHIAALVNSISMFSLSGEDPANRIGEMIVRGDVMQNVYFNLFFPSIPDDGYQGF